MSHKTISRKPLLAALLACGLLCAPGPAAAAGKASKFFEVWASGLGGGGWGKGDTHKDFFNYVKGGAAGGEVGVQLWFFSVYVDYLRWFGGAAGADMLGLNLGGDVPINLVGNLDLVIRLAGSYYYCTLPDDNTVTLDGSPVTYVNTRGVGGRGGVGLRLRFARDWLSVGIAPEVGYHYFFGGAHESALTDNSSGVDFKGMAYLRLSVGR